MDNSLRALALASVCVWCWIARRFIARGEIVPYEPHQKVPWRGWDLAIVFAGILVVLGTAMQIVAHAQSQHSSGLPSPSQFRANVIAETIGRAVCLVLAIVYLKVRRQAAWSDLGVVGGKHRRDVSLGFAAFLAASLPVYGLFIYLAQWFPYVHPLVQLLKEQHDKSTWLLAAWSAVIVAPISEEFVFRVLIQGWLEAGERRVREQEGAASSWPPGALPIVASSLFFALSHVDNGPDQIPLFIFALFLGFLYRQTHRLAPSVVTHMCLNATSMAQLWFATANHAA